MTIQLGNMHKNVPPTVSPYTGDIRTHRCAFFLITSRSDIIESVDLLLHSHYRDHRFVTLQSLPFTKAFLTVDYFPFTTFITLRDGWEWVSHNAINRSLKHRGPKDRLPVDLMLDIDGGGSQRVMSAQFRKIDGVDSILEALPGFLNEEWADVGGIQNGDEEV